MATAIAIERRFDGSKKPTHYDIKCNCSECGAQNHIYGNYSSKKEHFCGECNERFDTVDTSKQVFV
jgi:hypothetical protein